MLSQNIKERTHAAHQKTEGIVVRQLKAIRSEADYAEVLKGFYAYFRAVEDNIAPFVTTEVLPDVAERRNSSYIRKDIETLGGTVDSLPAASAPAVHTILEALSSLYVLEGSIMGGPYIVQMLNKYGIERGTSFFEGYGANSGQMWAGFITVLNKYGENPDSHQTAIDMANQTFQQFGEVFTAVHSGN
ncbi:MAG: biliverdin-producing heme oxygenase [Sphingobacterium sp.]|nr:biliverdin-producing heme oxygenase [Sphingobacterium sp.]